MPKTEQKKGFEFFLKKDLLAFLLAGYWKSLSLQLLVLLAKRAGNYASYVSHNASFQNY